MSEQITDLWPLLLTSLAAVLSALARGLSALSLLGKWGEGLNHEMFEPTRVFGGLLGVAAAVAVVRPLGDLQAEPIICLALLGGAISGSSERRSNWMAAGALLGFLYEVLDEMVRQESAMVVSSAQLWFAASLPPLGGLVAGYIRDEQKRAITKAADIAAVEATKAADAADATAAKAAEAATAAKVAADAAAAKAAADAQT